VERLTGREAEIRSADGAAVSLGGERVDVPDEGGGDVIVNGGEVRALAAGLPGEDGASLVLFGAPEQGSFLSSSPTVVVIVAGILLLALVMVLLLRRALARQVAAMLAAARRIGQGDFSEKVPVVGGRRDEMAGLAIEFNKMSGLLAEQMDQLRSQQVEIDRSVRRIGEAFASGLNRDQLLGILVETTVSACRADYGTIALSGREGAEVSSGEVSGPAAAAVLDAKAEASRSDQPVSREADGTHIVVAPLRPIGDPGHSLGVMAIARDRAFTDPERDVFLYLIGQASASIENVSLHELVSEQAVTDGLTGLANNRAFREVTEKEAARAERFGHALSLLMLDIDDFKKVNDTYGHLQGDEVLRRVGRILQAESRGIDEPARYGGEEFAVALPETDRRGAMELAERVRERIEAEAVPFLDRRGALKITASLGVATIPESAADVQGLIAAADAALYAAKRSGKNQVSLAPARSTANHQRAAAAAAEHGG
jgi:diguanylate cyclase (GGDEF)-like protein